MFEVALHQNLELSATRQDRQNLLQMVLNSFRIIFFRSLLFYFGHFSSTSQSSHLVLLSNGCNRTPPFSSSPIGQHCQLPSSFELPRSIFQEWQPEQPTNECAPHPHSSSLSLILPPPANPRVRHHNRLPTPLHNRPPLRNQHP